MKIVKVTQGSQFGLYRAEDYPDIRARLQGPLKEVTYDVSSKLAKEVFGIKKDKTIDPNTKLERIDDLLECFRCKDGRKEVGNV